MRTWALKRQMVGIAFFSFFALIFGGFAFFLYYNPISCTDGVKNGLEEGVDCGGPNCRSCLGEIRDLRLLWKRFFPVRDGFYDVGALFENQNLQLGSRQIDFTFKLYDADGVLLDTKRGSSFAYPNDRVFLYIPNMYAGSKEPARVDVAVAGVQWEKMQSPIGFDVTVSSKNYEGSPNPLVSLGIENRSIAVESGVEIFVLLERGDGNVFAASRTFTEQLKPGEERAVVFTWPGSSFETPSNIVPLLRRIPE